MSDGPPPSDLAPASRMTWRDGGARRVTLASAAVGVMSAAYASVRQLPPPVVLRASASAAALAAPLFAIREVVASSFAVQGPVASALVGGMAGYVGALAVSAASWRAASHSALVVGVGAGLVDALASNLDYRRKRFLVRRHDAAVASASMTSTSTYSSSSSEMPSLMTDCTSSNSMRRATTTRSALDATEASRLLAADAKRVHDGESNSLSSSVTPASSTVSSPTAGPADATNWSLWLPALNQMDGEYHDLIKRREATVVLLREEQERIARLLEAIDRLKQRRPPSSSATPRTPPPIATSFGPAS